MPRKSSPPSYRHHKARDCTVVTIAGHNHYLGPYGSPESHERYARLIAELHVAPALPAPPFSDRVEAPDSSGLTINGLVNAYRKFAETYYVRNGRPTGNETRRASPASSLRRYAR